MTRFSKFIVHPCGAVSISVSISFLAWIVPSLTGVSKGYIDGISFDASAWVMLLFWYSLIFSLSFVGYRLGGDLARSSQRQFLNEKGVFSDLYIWFLTLFGTLGVAAAFGVIVKNIGFSGVLDSIQGSQANLLKEALYEEYSIGLLSLRYITILAAGVALANFLIKRNFKFVYLVAWVGLLANAMVASRLSLVWAVSIGVGLYYMYDGLKKPLRVWALMLGAIFAFLALTGYNFARNYGTYENLGVYNPIWANVAEIQRYLAAPFQGSLAAAQNISDFALGVDPWMLSGIDGSLTTNSAIFAMIPEFGYAAFFVIAFLVFVGGFLMGFSKSRPGSIISISYFVIWYCFAELWRGNLFHAGITITLLTFTAFMALFAGGVFKSKPTFENDSNTQFLTGARVNRFRIENRRDPRARS